MIHPHHEAAAAAGADCTRCSLHGCGRGPVPPTLPPGRVRLLVVGEAPGVAEVEDGQTMVGPTGREVRQALGAAGVDPSSVGYTNTILCRPEDNDMARLLRECRRRKIPTPIECCRPRLQAELNRADYKLIVGSHALRAVGAGTSIIDARGFPIADDALATLHPAFVMRDQGRLMRGVFRFDVAKAVRHARGGGTWQAPTFTVVQTADQLRRLLDGLHGWVAVDTETNGIDPWTCRIRRVGISDGDNHIIFAPLSVNGSALMPPDELSTSWAVLREFFAQPRAWRFHNYYGYDSIVLRQHGIAVNEEQLFDSLVGHHIGPTSEYPHGLDFLGSIYTDTPYWKGGVEHTNTKSDEALDTYLATDLKVTHQAAPYVIDSIRRAEQWPIYELDAKLSAIGRNMAGLGVRIDRGEQLRLAVQYQAKSNKLRAQFVEAAGADINPGSVKQLKDLLYHKFALPVLKEAVTETGEPSTAEPVLLQLLEMGLAPPAKRVIHALLGWREAEKLISTYTGRVGRHGIEGGPLVHKDGRIRTTWKVYGTPSGRWSSGSPLNLQNVPKKLRSMFVPAPGNVFVGADYSALELRILAQQANDELLIKAFADFDAKAGPDIHVVNAMTIFKCAAEAVSDEPRTFAKRFVYGLSYGAGPPKIFQTMSLLRDDELRPVFQTITLQEIEHVYKTWWAAHPSIIAWRKQLLAGWRRYGYIATAWHGRRRYFLGGEDHEQMYNHPIQGSAADLQNTAVCKIVERYPFAWESSRGLILQIHDQNVIECGEGEAEQVKDLLQESMETKVGAMRFPAEGKVGKNWKAVS